LNCTFERSQPCCWRLSNGSMPDIRDSIASEGHFRRLYRLGRGKLVPGRAIPATIATAERQMAAVPSWSQAARVAPPHSPHVLSARSRASSVSRLGDDQSGQGVKAV
jgi:hypothetical protein